MGGSISTRGRSHSSSPIAITAITAAATNVDLSCPFLLASTREKSRIKVEIPAIPSDTKVIATVRLGTNSERSAAAPKLIAANSGMMNGFFIVISPSNYISSGMGVA